MLFDALPEDLVLQVVLSLESEEVRDVLCVLKLLGCANRQSRGLVRTVVNDSSHTFWKTLFLKTHTAEKHDGESVNWRLACFTGGYVVDSGLTQDTQSICRQQAYEGMQQQASFLQLPQYAVRCVCASRNFYAVFLVSNKPKTCNVMLIAHRDNSYRHTLRMHYKEVSGICLLEKGAAGTVDSLTLFYHHSDGLVSKYAPATRTHAIIMHQPAQWLCSTVLGNGKVIFCSFNAFMHQNMTYSCVHAYDCDRETVFQRDGAVVHGNIKKVIAYGSRDEALILTDRHHSLYSYDIRDGISPQSYMIGDTCVGVISSDGDGCTFVESDMCAHCQKNKHKQKPRQQFVCLTNHFVLDAVVLEEIPIVVVLRTANVLSLQTLQGNILRLVFSLSTLANDAAISTWPQVELRSVQNTGNNKLLFSFSRAADKREEMMWTIYLNKLFFSESQNMDKIAPDIFQEAKVDQAVRYNGDGPLRIWCDPKFMVSCDNHSSTFWSRL